MRSYFCLYSGMSGFGGEFDGIEEFWADLCVVNYAANAAFISSAAICLLVNCSGC